RPRSVSGKMGRVTWGPAAGMAGPSTTETKPERNLIFSCYGAPPVGHRQLTGHGKQAILHYRPIQHRKNQLITQPPCGGVGSEENLCGRRRPDNHILSDGPPLGLVSV